MRAPLARATLILAAALAASLLVPAGGALARGSGRRRPHARRPLASTKSAMKFFHRSTWPLAAGDKGCHWVAEGERVTTLGALVTAHLRIANVQKTAHCELGLDRRWSCEAIFVHTDKQHGDEHFPLIIDAAVDDETGKIESLKCVSAG